MSANVAPHDIDDCSSDQAILDDEGKQIGGGVLHDAAHDVDPATALGVNGSAVGGNQSGRRKRRFLEVVPEYRRFRGWMDMNSF